MASKCSKLVAVLVFLSLVYKSSAINCYYCNSANNSACLDLNEMDDETRARIIPVVNCGAFVMQPVAGNFFCRKIVQTSKCANSCCYGNGTRLNFNYMDVKTRARIIPVVDCAAFVMQPVAGNFFCRKIVQTIFNSKRDNEVRVTRGCGWVRSVKECYRADNRDHLETVCQCFQDYCNSGQMVTSETAAALFLLLSGVLYLYR